MYESRDRNNIAVVTRNISVHVGTRITVGQPLIARYNDQIILDNKTLAKDHNFLLSAGYTFRHVISPVIFKRALRVRTNVHNALGNLNLILQSDKCLRNINNKSLSNIQKGVDIP
jgi:hypothetical protein